MYSKIKSIILGLVLFLVISSSVLAGGNSGQVGIGFTVTESTPTFLMHYWVSETFTFSPELSFNSLSEPELKRYSFGGTFAYHMKQGSDFRPTIGFFVINDVLRTEDDSYSDLYFGPLVGAEYFFNYHFSVSGLYKVEIIKTNDVLSPSFLQTDATYISTAQLLTVQYYF